VFTGGSCCIPIAPFVPSYNSMTSGEARICPLWCSIPDAASRRTRDDDQPRGQSQKFVGLNCRGYALKASHRGTIGASLGHFACLCPQRSR
jgi:hypothetical protein